MIHSQDSVKGNQRKMSGCRDLVYNIKRELQQRQFRIEPTTAFVMFSQGPCRRREIGLMLQKKHNKSIRQKTTTN